ncbi:hypothetical protein EJ02DRAFT_449661 [Clathrospora elynae]|uniref:Uncharacterized protein n=1 Tax=Clathrospora elynae TaxID=706981 RepID=A0A6A5T5X1_9PLEO|nr:hypothetical protein EJ02DRAFT_449661 [Clathrospora elynae]
MGHIDFAEVGGICGYAKVKYEERVETKRRRRRSSSDPTTSKIGTYGKLHKPPTIQSLHERPRNKLQKRTLTTPLNVQSSKSLFVLEYDPYPYNTRPSEFLGVYSSIDSVTAGAFRHGAYTFSREGLLDGSEYLSPTGRIKIVSHAVQSVGVIAEVPEKSKSAQGKEVVRLDIPHPKSQGDLSSAVQVGDASRGTRVKETVFLAVHEGPQSAFCIGLFTSKDLAWGACLKEKAWLAWSDELAEEERCIEEGNVLRVSARVVGRGRHSWFVRVHEIDSLGR